MKEKYPGSSADAIDFLDKILQFNPYKRLTLKDAFEHPLFSGFEKVVEPSTPDQRVQSNQNRQLIAPLSGTDLSCETFSKLMDSEIDKLRNSYIPTCTN